MQCRALLLAIAMAVTPSPSSAVNPEFRRLLRSFTWCEAYVHPKEAAEVVLSEGLSEDITHSEFMSPNYCLGSFPFGTDPVGPMDREFVLFGLAEALLRQDYWNGLPADIITQAASLTHAQVNDSDYEPAGGKETATGLAELQGRKRQAYAMRGLSIFGECVARADPSTAFGLVTSVPDTSYEDAAFRKLKPALSSCLEKGKSIVLDKAAVRGAIALNLYRLAKAPRVQSTTVTK